MSSTALASEAEDCGLEVSYDEDVAVLRFTRVTKRNAMNDATIMALGRFIDEKPDTVRAIMLCAAGENFCAGLDLSEHVSRGPEEVMFHSQMWHRILNAVQFSGIPVVTVMKGAVIGGGLEIAASTHIRVAEDGAYYALPEAARGIYVGGGASVRVARLIGAGRMAEIMLTGRILTTEEGHDLGISHYKVAPGEGEKLGLKLARHVAKNAPMSNFAIINAVQRIADMSATDGFFTESLMAAVVQSRDDSTKLLRDFLDKKAPPIGVQ